MFVGTTPKALLICEFCVSGYAKDKRTHFLGPLSKIINSAGCNAS